MKSERESTRRTLWPLAFEQGKAKAGGTVINNFGGIVGNVLGSQVQIGDYASIHGKLKNRGIEQCDRNEIEDILDDLDGAPPDKKRSLVRRGLGWVAKHASKLGPLSQEMRAWFEAAKESG